MKTFILCVLLLGGVAPACAQYGDPGKDGKCVIQADNSQQPLKTSPWNFFTCGKNRQGFVWLVGISRLPSDDGGFMLQMVYLPTHEAKAYSAMNLGDEGYFRRPDGQSLQVKVVKRRGTFRDWQSLEAWVEVVGEYAP